MKLKLIRAKKKDTFFFYKLRNDIINRKSSVSSKKIKYESHKNWFLKAIKKKTNFILIIKKNKINCGYLRYEKKLNFYIVSVCITKKFRNKNIALSALLIGDKKVKKNKKFKLKAIVKKNNFPSIKLFFKAGYFLQKKEKNLIFFEK